MIDCVRREPFVSSEQYSQYRGGVTTIPGLTFVIRWSISSWPGRGQVIWRQSLVDGVEEPATTAPGVDELDIVDDLDKSWPLSFLYRSRSAAPIGCLNELRDGEASLPLLHDRTEEFYNNRSAGYVGGYVSALELCRFYDRLGAVYRGSEVTGFPIASIVRRALAPPVAETETSDASVDASVMESGCPRFGLGLACDLPSHGLSTAEDVSFGHMGVVRSSFGYCEPEKGVAVAGVLRGIDLSHLDQTLAGWCDFTAGVRSLLA